MSACREGLLEGTAVTESLHKWNTTPCTIASHKPELWRKCFSNMAWICPWNIEHIKKTKHFWLPFKQETEEGWACCALGLGSVLQTMLAVFVNFNTGIHFFCLLNGGSRYDDRLHFETFNGGSHTSQRRFRHLTWDVKFTDVQGLRISTSHRGSLLMVREKALKCIRST